jgi:hypothetical protein
MYYTNFDDNITAKWRVILEGWPLQKFCSPADLSTRNEVQLLLHAWQNGTAHFRRLSEEEWEAWEAARFQAALDEMAGEEDEDYLAELTERDNNNPDGPVAGPTCTMVLSNEPVEVVPQVSDSLQLTDQAPMRSRQLSTQHNNPPPPKRRKVAPLGTSQFVNTLTSADGTPITVAKKPRKPRSDKGKTRGPRTRTLPINTT